jgi:glutathione S-transferase
MDELAPAPFAPPILVVETLVIAQTANILLFLGRRHKLAPEEEIGRLWVNQLQLTIADLVDEAHDTHHPLASGLYYEDQKAAAIERASHFRKERMPKYLGYFERILAGGGESGAGLAGAALTYADLSLFQAVRGLQYAFPRAMEGLAPKLEATLALVQRVEQQPRIAAYLKSERRIPFNEEGIFRRYPELDGE